jgi:hypothetical protein
MLKLGIVYEGGSDIEVVREVILKLLPIGSFEVVNEIPAKMGIIGFIPTYSRRLFEQDRADFVVFLTDQDVSKSKDDRRKSVIDKLKALKCIERSAVGIATPHIEQWLFADEDVIKHLFDLPRDKPLPYGDLPPKNRLNAIRNSFTGEKLSDHETKLEIIRKIDVERMRTYPDFNLFASDLISKFKLILDGGN